MITLIIEYVVLGAFAGLLSGLLGIGGGLVVVPGLAFIFAQQHLADANIMQLAAGTSLAVMIFTTGRGLLAHRRWKVDFWSIYKGMLLFVIIGTVCGVLLAHVLHSDVLRIILGVVVFVIVAKLLFWQRPESAEPSLPSRRVSATAATFIGSLSGLLGIGGGTLMTPFLLYFSVPLRQAMVVAIATSLTVALVGSVSFMLAGMHVANLPAHTLGYVYWPAWIGVAVGSLLCAPIGVKLAHRLPTALLTKIFAFFLLLVGIHLLIYAS